MFAYLDPHNVQRGCIGVCLEKRQWLGQGVRGCSGRMDGQADAGMGRKREVEGSGVSRRTRKYLFSRVRFSTVRRRLRRPSTGRDGQWAKPGRWVGQAQGAPPPPHPTPAIDNPAGTSPISTPLSTLSAWRARASPINFIFLLICSPFRNSGSIDSPFHQVKNTASLIPSRVDAGDRGCFPWTGHHPGGAAGIPAIVTAGALCH